MIFVDSYPLTVSGKVRNLNLDSKSLVTFSPEVKFLFFQVKKHELKEAMEKKLGL